MADPVRVGPIVGEVTASTARVVVQAARRGTLDLTLTPASGPPVSRSSSVEAREIVAFEFTELAPETSYALSVDFEGADLPERSGRVVTKPSSSSDMHLAALSCNFTTKQGDARLWERLWDKWVRPGTIATVLHAGDQVYADTAFGRALEEVRGRRRTNALRRECQRAFEDLYVHTWNYAPTRSVLAHASNLMIWDDHEIRNSWGGYAHDRDPDSDEFFVGEIAHEVFQRFQRALWARPDPTAAHEGHAHRYGGLGILFVDQRTGRSFSYDPERPYLGPAQWSWLRGELRSGTLSQVTALVVVTAVPLCYVGQVTAGLGGFLMSDLRDHWTHPDHMTEQIELFSEIRRWLRVDPNRRVLVVGGDVHVGGSTTAFHRVGDQWEPLFQQIIASPITNRPPNIVFFAGLRDLILRRVHDVGDTYRFDHDEASFTNRRNFAVITLRTRSGSPATIHASLETDADD